MSETTTNLEWHTEKRRIDALLPYPQNPRRLTEDQHKQLERSLKKFNLVEIPAINQDGTILAGHQRLKVLQLMGRGSQEIDVRLPNRMLTEDEVREYNLRSNKNTGEWDFDLLAEFGEIMLSDVGFDSKELDKIFDLHSKPEDDDAPDLPEQSAIKPGQIWQMGPHRIICGDSTDPLTLQFLMNNEKAEMVFTDPPYNINYSGRGKNTSNTIENDNMEEAAFRKLLIDAFTVANGVLMPKAGLYCCYASRTHREFEDALNAAGFEVRNQIIWVKLVASMGWGNYRWKHEPIFYCNKANEACEFYGDRSQYTTWDEEKTDQELLDMFKKMITKDENGNSTVWRFSREQNYKHPTQKPVALVGKAIQNSSKRGGIVLDMFSGSGSTLIACENSARIFRGVELDPRYVEVIIKRWEEATNEKAVLI